MKLSSPWSAVPATPRRRIFALALLASSVPAHAVDYSASGSLESQVQYNDNLRLVDSDAVEEDAVTKYMLTPKIRIGASSERTTAELQSIFYFNKYNESKFDSNDQNFALNLSHKLETSTLALSANVVRDSTVTSEQLTTGLVGDRAIRAQRYVLTPSWTYFFNDSNMLQLGGVYTKQDYSTSAGTEYENTTGSLDWVHILTERIKLVLSASYDDQQYGDQTRGVPPVTIPISDPILASILGPEIAAGQFGEQTTSSETKGSGGTIGVDYQWTEQSQLQARLGQTSSKTEHSLKSTQNFCSELAYRRIVAFIGHLGQCEPTDDSKDTLLTATLGWSWKNEVSTFNLNGTKRTQPTSNGYTVDQIQVNSNWGYDLTELDHLGVGVQYIRNRALDGAREVPNSAYADRDYHSVSMSYRRQIGDKWFVSANYVYQNQKYPTIGSDAKANSMALSVEYRPQSWHWAR